MKKNIIFCMIVIIINSCQYPKLSFDELIYDNDFENKVLSNITGGEVINFEGNNIIGNFNNDGFTVHIDDVKDHDYVFISFDLYIHGSWDGNKNGFSDNDKADKWLIEFKPDMNLYNDSQNTKFITTFSNSPCWPDYCLQQSYPNNYPSQNIPKTGAFKTSLSKICDNNFFGGKTSLYKMEKGFRSSGNAVIIRFYDELYQPNAIDQYGINQSKCDESWSMDNLKIRLIKYD